MSKQLPHAVILGLSPTGLYVARELGRAGVCLLGVTTKFSCASLSRYFERGRIWHEASRSDLLKKLTSYSTNQSVKPVLFPTSDYYIEFVLQNYSKLSKSFLMADCYSAVAHKLLDKAKFHQLCLEHGVDTPKMWKVSSGGDLDCISEPVNYPCILKPIFIHLAKPYMRGRKVIVIKGQDELKIALQNVPDAAGDWLLQEIIPGPESGITLVAGYACKDENVQDYFTARKLRQYPTGFGSASKVVSETCVREEHITSNFLEKIGFQGVYGAEFKYDSRDGSVKIIEINPRPTLWFQLSNEAGKKIVERAYRDLAGLEVVGKASQLDGVVWQYGLKDLVSSVNYRLKRACSVFPHPDLSRGGRRTKLCWPVFSMSDPLPVIAELFVYIRELVLNRN